MTLACVLDLHNRPATLAEIVIAADRDGDPLAAAILRTPDPAETVEALYAYATVLESAYPGCSLSIDLSDLAERALRDPRLDHLVTILETPMTTIPAEALAAAIAKTPDPDETVSALVDFVAELERDHPDADPEIVIGDLAERAKIDPRLSALVAVLETP